MRAICLIRNLPHYRFDAFTSGLRACGYTVQTSVGAGPRPNDLLVIWNRYGTGAAMADQYERAGAKVLVCENGYVGRDSQGRQYYAIALHGHNGAGTWPVGGPERWDQLGVVLQPWRAQGEHVLVCPQRGFGPVEYTQPAGWADDVVRRLRQYTARPIRIRPHPGNKPADVPLAHDLQNCWAMVTWASGAATHALIAGIPVFHESPYIATKGAAQSGIQEIESPAYPDRLPVFQKLAWGQWSVEEIERGEPFARLCNATHT